MKKKNQLKKRIDEISLVNETKVFCVFQSKKVDLDNININKIFEDITYNVKGCKLFNYNDIHYSYDKGLMLFGDVKIDSCYFKQVINIFRALSYTNEKIGLEQLTFFSKNDFPVIVVWGEYVGVIAPRIENFSGDYERNLK
jgi:hypothetical protein